MNGEIRLDFAYDDELLDLVRAIPGRRWAARQKCWFIPAGHIPTLLAAEKELLRRRKERLGP